MPPAGIYAPETTSEKVGCIVDSSLETGSPPQLLFSNFVVQRQTILFINTQMILALIENQMKITSIQGVSPHNRVVILGELYCLTHIASVIISLFKRMFKYFGEIVTQKFFISFQPYNRVPLTPPLPTP